MNFDDGWKEKEECLQTRKQSQNDKKKEKEMNSLSHHRANFFAFIARFHER